MYKLLTDLSKTRAKAVGYVAVYPIFRGICPLAYVRGDSIENVNTSVGFNNVPRFVFIASHLFKPVIFGDKL